MAEQRLELELEHEADGRWLAEVIDLPGVLAYGIARDPPYMRSPFGSLAQVPQPGDVTRR